MRILVHLKSESEAIAVVNMAKLFAQRLQAQIAFLAISPQEGDNAKQENLLEWARSQLAEYPVLLKLRIGKAVPEILLELKEEQYDLVLVKARKKLNLLERFGGKIARKVALQAPTSVLVVKDNCPEVKRILICTGGLSLAEPVIEMGAALAKAFGAAATILHVMDIVPLMYSGLAEIEETLPEVLDSGTPMAEHFKKAAQILANAGVEGNLEIRHGLVVDEILGVLSQNLYQLMIVGTPKNGGLIPTPLLGDVAQEITNLTPIPVLLYRPR